MFGIEFSEFVIIAVIALVVLGPERLPKAARTVGRWVGKLQRLAASVRSDLDRELRLEELRQLQRQIQETAERAQADIRAQEQSLHVEIEQLRAENRKLQDQPAAPEAPARPPEPV